MHVMCVLYSVCFALRLIAYQTCQGYWSHPPDFERAGMSILWVSNPAHSYSPFMQRINRSRRQGEKLVVVDPRLSVSAKKADFFQQLRPGTDAALSLGPIRWANFRIRRSSPFGLKRSATKLCTQTVRKRKCSDSQGRKAILR